MQRPRRARLGGAPDSALPAPHKGCNAPAELVSVERLILHKKGSTRRAASLQYRECSPPRLPRMMGRTVAMEPIYTPQNCQPAYQLDWSYSVFWRTAPRESSWFFKLQEACEPDGIRVLEHAFTPPHTSQFLISSKPEVAPLLIAQRVKGRLQYLIRDQMVQAFRRNYSLRSIGSTRREKLEALPGWATGTSSVGRFAHAPTPGTVSDA